MQENVRKYLTKLKENRKLRRRNQLVMIAVGLLVVSGVFGMLIMPGLGEETEPVLVCEKAEHTHEDACRGVTCTQEEHEHGDDCKQLNCTIEVHEHSVDTCGVTYTCENEEEGHEHTVDACSYEYACGKETHSHDDNCYTYCDKTVHTHTEECYGYICDYTEEHVHTDECYKTVSDDTTNIYAIAPASEDDGTINEGLVLGFGVNTQTITSGNPLSVRLFSNYSKANNTGTLARVTIDVSNLPEGISLNGFENGEKTYTYTLSGETGNVEQQITLKFDGNSITYEQPQGSTLDIALQFTSKNGITENDASVTLNIDQTKITGLEEGTSISCPNGFYSSSNMIWNAANSWEPVEKKVNGSDENTIAVKEDNTLSGSLTYAITAISNNNDSYGEIWTKEVKVTDKLTLPDKISLPSNAKIEDGKIVIDINGEKKEILSFLDLPTGTTVELKLLDDNKTISYSLAVPNTNMIENVPTKEQAHLKLTMVLNAELLVLVDGYNEQDAGVTADKITNTVTIRPIPYKGEPGAESTDTVTTVPKIPEEEWTLVKSSTNTKGVQAGGEIEYTLTLSNIGEKPIKVQLDENTYYTVTDKLPEQLFLTETQINALPEGVEYDSESNTIIWTPSTTAIPCGDAGKKAITFKTTVKAIDDDAIKNLKNGYKISNTALFKEKTSNKVDVEYLKAYLTINKTGTTEEGDDSVHDEEKITYTIVVSNPSELDYLQEETVKDTLPTGLDLGAVYVGETKLTVTNGTAECQLHESTIGCGKEHKVIYNVADRELSWNIGSLAAGESVTIKYECTANMDTLTGSRTTYLNTAKISDVSDYAKIGIDYPITLEKSVAEDTTQAYASGSVLNYTIKVKNDEKHPTEKTDLVLTDTMSEGLVPYPEENGDGTLYLAEVNGVTQKIEWSDFVSGKYTVPSGSYSFYTTIDGKQADVALSNTGGVILTWKLGKLDPGILELTYQAQLTLTEEQLATGTAYTFTNTAIIDTLMSSVTVKGGTLTGKLSLEKVFSKYNLDGTFEVLTLGNKDTDSKWDIEFVLTQVDEDGEILIDSDGKPLYQRTISMKDFTGPTADSVYEYKIDNLPIGSYKIEEKNFNAAEGYEAVSEFSYFYQETPSSSWWKIMSEGSATFDLSENSEIEIEIENKTCPYGTVLFQKSVYEIGTMKAGASTWTSLPEKYVFSIDKTGAQKTYVVYNITLSYVGGDYISIDKVKDKLPEGLKYKGLCSTASYAKNASVFSDYINTSVYNNFNNGVTVEGGNISYKPKVAGSPCDYLVKKVSYDEGTNEVELAITGYGINRLWAGGAITFGMLCEVESDVTVGQELTNTAEITVTGAKHISEKVYNTTNTPYDDNQNNGKSMLESEDIENDQKVISSSVSILPENTVVPGIEKNAVSYLVGNTPVELGEYDNIDPNSAVKWEVTVHNNGTQDIIDYSIQDIVTEPFHLMTKEEATACGVSEPYTYQIYNYKGTQLYTENISERVWAEVANDTKVSEYTFDFTVKDYAIPAGGYAVLSLHTYNTDGGKDIYTNTATIYPTQEITANEVEYGELVKDSTTNQYIGVKASDQVYALGEYASVSWKTITEEDDLSNTARGTWSKNYILVDDASKVVTYTNNVRNISSNGFNKFVMIDLMPMINDTGVVNRNDRRGSEFKVFYAADLSLTVVDGFGNTVDVSDRNFTYAIQFSNKTSFTQSDFNGEENSRWHDTYQDGDCSFRIVMNPEFELKSQETLVVQYDGKIEDGAVPGSIAWNSFGYQYYLSSEPEKFLRAEPPKVGVMIPNAPIIQKEVIDVEGNELEKDANITFTFALYEIGKNTAGVPVENYLCKFELCQGGFSYLTELKDTNGNAIKLEDGKEYVIKELTDEAHMPKGYTMVGIGEDNGKLGESYSFTYYQTKNINILARNQVEEYVSELPATGSFSALAYKAVGVLLVILAGLVCSCRLIIRRKQRMVK